MMEEELDADRRSFDTRVRRVLESKVSGSAGGNGSGLTWSGVAGAGAGATPSSSKGNGSSHERNQYLAARKSARFWPIEGKLVS